MEGIFRVLPVRHGCSSFVHQTAIENPQISARGPPNWISQRQKAKGDVNKDWVRAKGPGDATSHLMAQSDFRITGKLITR